MTKANLWEEAIARQRGSGLSAVEFCRREGLKIALFIIGGESCRAGVISPRFG